MGVKAVIWNSASLSRTDRCLEWRAGCKFLYLAIAWSEQNPSPWSVWMWTFCSSYILPLFSTFQHCFRRLNRTCFPCCLIPLTLVNTTSVPFKKLFLAPSTQRGLHWRLFQSCVLTGLLWLIYKSMKLFFLDPRQCIHNTIGFFGAIVPYGLIIWKG